MGESFRINPEFRILRLTFQESQPQYAEYGKSCISSYTRIVRTP